MPIIQTEIEIAAPIERCFELARDITVHTRTVWKHTRERAVAGRTEGGIGLGETVTFRATHLGVRQKLTSKIVVFERPFLFVDEMQKGAFKFMRHEHHFEQVDGGTLMKDVLSFQAPLGVFGRMADGLVLTPYMRRFLEDRNHELKILLEKE